MADKKLTFEEAYTRLEAVATKLGGSDITLDETISLYEEGIKLSKYCADALREAKLKIEVLENE